MERLYDLWRITAGCGISNTFASERQITYTNKTISKHIDYLEEAFLISKSNRYDIKGRKYVGANLKYYFTDWGLRNARLNFRQQEPTHIMENIVYNELVVRGFSVDVGVVFSREINSNNNSVRVPREVDFVVTGSGRKVYIQSAFALETKEKEIAELKPFSLIGDSFPKIIVRKDIRKKWYDENGILNIGLIEFLLDENLV